MMYNLSYIKSLRKIADLTPRDRLGYVGIYVRGGAQRTRLGIRNVVSSNYGTPQIDINLKFN